MGKIQRRALNSVMQINLKKVPRQSSSRSQPLRGRYPNHTKENILKDSVTKGLFTWSGGPRSSGVGFFCFHAMGNTKQKKPTPLDRGPPLHVNRPLNLSGT